MAGAGLMSRAFGACVAAAALGCTMQTSGDVDDSNFAPDESNLGELRQAIEQSYDRPAAAAVGVGVNGGFIREMWVFVCDSNNVLKRRRKASWTSSWENWETAASTPCSGVPTAGAGQATPKDDVEVFFRSTTGKLIELYYRPNGTTLEFDLSAELGLGDINGNPVIADMGVNGHIAVAYRKNPSNYLMTLTWTPGSGPNSGWNLQNTDAAGAVGRGHGQLTALYTPQLSYLAAQYDGIWRVYTRSTWSAPYVQVNESMNFIWSVLTFAAPTPTSMVAVSRDSIGRVIKSDVVPDQPWAFGLANTVRVAGTPFMAGSWNYENARNYENDVGAAACGRAAIFGQHCALYGLDDSQDESFYSTPGMLSAGTRPVNAGGHMDGYVFWTDSVNHLYEANLWKPQDSVAKDMAIITLPP
jgi:hypothetical protein